MTNKNYTENDKKQSELRKAFDEIDEILSRKTKEERLAYFSKIGFPRNLNYNLDFGNSVIMVRTHFEGSRDETVSETIERIVLKSK